MALKEDMVKIDINMLDTECVEHPVMYFQVSEELIEEKERYERIKLKLDIKVSELKLDIIRNPSRYQVEKTPEYVIDAIINVDEEIIALKTKMLTIKFDIDHLQAGVNSLEHKKRMIESLVTLHGNQYFAAPKVTQAGMEEVSRKHVESNFKPRKPR